MQGHGFSPEDPEFDSLKPTLKNLLAFPIFQVILICNHLWESTPE